jgi:hypothetical protein
MVALSGGMMSFKFMAGKSKALMGGMNAMDGRQRHDASGTAARPGRHGIRARA